MEYIPERDLEPPDEPHLVPAWRAWGKFRLKGETVWDRDELFSSPFPTVEAMQLEYAEWLLSGDPEHYDYALEFEVIEVIDTDRDDGSDTAFETYYDR